jgi:hypothetical protein
MIASLGNAYIKTTVTTNNPYILEKCHNVSSFEAFPSVDVVDGFLERKLHFPLKKFLSRRSLNGTIYVDIRHSR